MNTWVFEAMDNMPLLYSPYFQSVFPLSILKMLYCNSSLMVKCLLNKTWWCFVAFILVPKHQC